MLLTTTRCPQSEAASLGTRTAGLVAITAEIRAIRQAAQRHRLQALLALAVGTGAREGELLAIGREHCDLAKGTLSIQRSLAVVKGGFQLSEPKSKRGRRVVEIRRFCVDALQRHLAILMAEGNLDAPVIFCTRTGHYISKSSFIRQVWRPLLKRAGVAYRKFHTLRHTYISRELAHGENVIDVARRVGDRPEVILKNYGHWIPGDSSRSTSRLDALYGIETA